MAKQEHVVADAQLESWRKVLQAHTFSPQQMTYMEMEAIIEELIASRKIHRAALRLAAKWNTRGQKVDSDDFYEAINEVCESVDTVPRFPIL